MESLVFHWLRLRIVIIYFGMNKNNFNEILVKAISTQTFLFPNQVKNPIKIYADFFAGVKNIFGVENLFTTH
jgi:hypothetical protein